MKLQNFGLNKKVLIIAGGNSIIDFRFDKLSDIIFFGINFQFLNKTKYGKNIKLDYQLYTDKIFSDLSRYMDFRDTKLIGYKPTQINDVNLLSEKADYYFNENILEFEKDSCYYAIQVCYDIMKFKKIYIIGLDGYSNNGQIHYWGDKFKLNNIEYKIHENEKKMIEKVQFKKMREYYKKLNNYKNIYNCNPYSRITTFRYNLPWGKE
jgi:hypothetical protein